MDSNQFDSLSRFVALTPTRRTAFSLATALSLGALWEGVAKRRKKKKRKRRCKPRCAGKECGANGCNGTCGSCQGGTCQQGQCVNGTLPVDATCDPELGRACSSGVCGCVGTACTCREATCIPAGLIGNCVEASNPDSDRHCCDGACGCFPIVGCLCTPS